MVWVQPLPGHSKWFKVQVSSQEALRPYQVRTEYGRLYLRNHSHLYKVPENFQAMPDKDTEEIEGQCSKLYSPPGNLLRRHSRCPLNLQHCSYQMFHSQIYSQLRQVFLPPVSTRTGRIVRRPAYLRDFTT